MAPSKNRKSSSSSTAQSTQTQRSASPSLPEADIRRRNQTLREGFLGGEIHAAVVQIYEDERPLLGQAAELDWLFQGAISSGIRSGFITGKKGELALIPLNRAHGPRPYLISLGMGPHLPQKIDEPLFRRRKPDEDLLQQLLNRILKLCPQSVGMSCQDFGLTEGESPFERQRLPGISVTLFR